METVIGFVVGFVVGTAQGHGGLRRTTESIQGIAMSATVHEGILTAATVTGSVVRQFLGERAGSVWIRAVESWSDRGSGAHSATRAA